jgi:hypothetical protein
MAIGPIRWRVVAPFAGKPVALGVVVALAVGSGQAAIGKRRSAVA